MDCYLCAMARRMSVLVFGAIVLILGTPAYGATMVARDMRGNVVWLYEEPCAHPEVLEKVKDALHTSMRRSSIYYEGKQYKACWIIGPDNLVYVVDETGEYLRLPPEAFRQDHGA